jgi:polyhydroxyalkanoate synthesis regulator phasin
MSEKDTIPIDFGVKIQVLWEQVQQLQMQQIELAKQNWIREQEVWSLNFEVHALRLRILELEEKRKGLGRNQS